MKEYFIYKNPLERVDKREKLMISDLPIGIKYESKRQVADDYDYIQNVADLPYVNCYHGNRLLYIMRDYIPANCSYKQERYYIRRFLTCLYNFYVETGLFSPVFNNIFDEAYDEGDGCITRKEIGNPALIAENNYSPEYSI